MPQHLSRFRNIAVVPQSGLSGNSPVKRGHSEFGTGELGFKPGSEVKICPSDHSTLSPHDQGDSLNPSLISTLGWDRASARDPQGPK